MARLNSVMESWEITSGTGMPPKPRSVSFGMPFLNASVVRVIAETLPTLEPSIGVLRKAGFQFIG
ncbi:MAG: hypothetical protein O6942_05220, partial [Bacteroidetes bacterium]|nr:hypothetical protein [Bacteroidota bacterium]